MGELSIWHILLILVVVLIFFGPSRLPGLGNSLGKAIRGFKDGMKNLEGNGSNSGSDVKMTSSGADSHSEREAQKTADHQLHPGSSSSAPVPGQEHKDSSKNIS